MRTLDEIINMVRDGGKPEYEELRYAICAFSALTGFDGMAITKLAEAEREKKKPRLIWSAMFQYEESFMRWKRALAKDPKEYIGWNNDPDNPDFLKRRAAAKKLAEKVLNDQT